MSETRSYLAPSRSAIALSVLSLVSGVALLGVSGWLIARAAQQPPIMYLQMAIVGVRAFALARAFFRYVSRLRSHDFAFRGLATLRSNIMSRVVPLGVDGLVRTGRGRIQATMVRDVDMMQDLPLRVIEPMWAHGLTVVIALLAMATVSLAAAGTTLLFGTLAWAISRRLQDKSSHALARIETDLGGANEDDIRIISTHIELLTAYDAVSPWRKRIRSRDVQLINARTRFSIGLSVVTSIWVVAGGLATIVIVWSHPVANAPLFTALALIPLGLAEVAQVLPSIRATRRQVDAARRRIADAIPCETPTEIPRDPDNPALLPQVMSVELRKVSGRYPEMAGPAVSGVTFCAQQGDVVVITGRSGSGKSTLAKLLVRFIEFDGEYLLGGVDARSFSLDDVRRTVGLCEQTPHIFGTTLRHNLDFANDAATDDELWRVLERVRLQEWAAGRDGLDTDLGTRGNLVSGGQAHRIALARILLAESPVVILDEPTASLEPPLAAALLDDFIDATADRILILISHDDINHPRVTSRIAL